MDGAGNRTEMNHETDSSILQTSRNLPSAVFQLEAPYQPQGDQPRAIAELLVGLQAGETHQTLLGATGT